MMNEQKIAIQNFQTNSHLDSIHPISGKVGRLRKCGFISLFWHQPISTTLLLLFYLLQTLKNEICVTIFFWEITFYHSVSCNLFSDNHVVSRRSDNNEWTEASPKHVGGLHLILSPYRLPTEQWFHQATKTPTYCKYSALWYLLKGHWTIFKNVIFDWISCIM